jgi:dipeptidyl aminopeptidase/acylaminoacyl peptidase
MLITKRVNVTVGLALIAGLAGLARAQKRAIVPSDCLNIHYVDRDSVSLSLDSSLLAYIVKAPGGDSDSDLRHLYVMEPRKPDSAREVIAGDKISEVKWLPDGKRVLMLMNQKEVTSVVDVDVLTGHVTAITHTERDVLEYSSDSAGTSVVFTTPNLDVGKQEPITTDSDELQNGYRISFDKPLRASQQTINLLYRTSLKATGEWTTPAPIIFQDPYNGNQAAGMPGLRYLSLSPDGRKLLFTYSSGQLPDTLRKSAMWRYGTTVLYDFQSEKITLPMPLSGSVWSIPLWSRDGQSFIAVAKPPVNSSWERRDIADHRTEGADVDVFWISLDSGEIQEVFAHAPDDHKGPLAWLENGDVILQTSARTVTRFHREGGEWKQISNAEIPITNYYRFSIQDLATSDGTLFVGTYQTPGIPQDVFSFVSTQNKLQVVTKLNPQFEELKIAPFEKIDWKTSTGFSASGFLFMPPDYVPGRRYPLVIQTKGNQGWFSCDSGSVGGPSFQPEPLADAGMMYLVRYTPDDWKQADEIAQYPKQYPGGLGEAAHLMDVWERAIESLDKRGLIDSAKVGIIGFSRTGWEVEFDLVHSKVKFAAATATDNITYSLGEYWLRPDAQLISEYDAMYGGPPYGKTVKNWLDYSISFNMDKIHTPLLMELSGYGAQDDVPGMIPEALAADYEVFTGLSRLGKPVEFYYYPNSNHTMDVGQGHVANLNRNYDWYRFWLQGYEDPAPSKREQYQRWEHLRELRDADQKAAGSSSTNPTQPD